MNRFQNTLLELSYDNYLKTGNSYNELFVKNLDDFYYYTTSAEALVDSGYITPLSDNICETTTKMTYNDFLIRYELTDLGLEYAREHYKKN